MFAVYLEQISPMIGGNKNGCGQTPATSDSSNGDLQQNGFG
jgi:hypothetical protein